MFFRLKPTRSGQVLKLVESYRDDTARPRHRAVASLGVAPPPGTAEVIDGVRADAVSRSQVQAAAISVINRLAAPSSEHSLPDWYRRTGLPELMGNQLRGAGEDRSYRVSDLLLSRQREIERHLRERQRSLFNLERTVRLYDLTNTHFEGLCQRNPKAKRGANKQKRNDCAQIVVGMVFDQFGFEMAHKIGVALRCA